MLSITGGGAATATSVSIYNTSLLAVDVGRGSSLAVAGGAGTITNSGTIRLLAGAGVPADSTKYSPISAGTWAGTGTYQAIGGKWDGTAHTFTASSVTSGTSGSLVPIDRASVQRVLISDNGPGGTGWVVGASFPWASSTSNMTFTATAIADTILGGQTVLSGWTFATSGYDVSASNPIYLSLAVGAGHSRDDLELWHYDGSTWTAYSPFDLTYDGTYASFTATRLSGYAMTGTAVPEPGTPALLAAGLVGLVLYSRRKRK